MGEMTTREIILIIYFLGNEVLCGGKITEQEIMHMQ